MRRDMRIPIWPALVCAAVLSTTIARGAAAQDLAADLRPLVSFDAQQRPGQTPARPTTPARSTKKGPGFRAFFAYDFNFMTAHKSFDAVLGTSMLQALGGGGEITRLWKDLFFRVGLSFTSHDGERVFALDDGTVVSLGIPTTVSMTPLELGVGWRFEPKPRVTRPGTPARPGTPTPARPGQPQASRTTSTAAPAKPGIVPYVGGGLLIVRYKETSDFANADENTDKTFPGFFGLAGVEFPLGKLLFAGAEAQFRSVPNALGTELSGVSTTFNETDLGGFTVRVMVGIRK